jgi:hypothetical protein
MKKFHILKSIAGIAETPAPAAAKIPAIAAMLGNSI